MHGAEPKYSVYYIKEVEKDLKGLDKPLAREAVLWINEVLPFEPTRKAALMKYVKVPTWRCKPSDRLRILFQIYDEAEIFVMAVGLRKDDTYDQKTLKNRQKKVDRKRQDVADVKAGKKVAEEGANDDDY